MDTNETIREINGKQVFIVEKHNEVLPFWSRFKNIKPYIVSFDHHTDLHLAFQHKICGIGNNYNVQNQNQFFGIQKKLLLELEDNNFVNIMDLKNDEHIDAAIKLGYIEKALVYSFDSYYNRLDRVYTIDHDMNNYSDQTVVVNSTFQKENNTIISSEALSTYFNFFNDYIAPSEWRKKYILDIDLDFFKTKHAINPIDNSFFKSLINGAIAITIAIERLCVTNLREDDDLDADYLLDRLITIIEE